MACVETNVPPAGTAPPADKHQAGGFVRMERCGSPTFWVNDINANCHSIFNLKAINCIPLSNFLTTPMQTDLDMSGHAITNAGKILVGSSVDDGSGALLQVSGEINARSYMVTGVEFASSSSPSQIQLSNISTINGLPLTNPQGQEGSVQFYDDGTFMGDGYFIYDEITHSLQIGIQGPTTPQYRLAVGGDINITDPTRVPYAFRINGIPFAELSGNSTSINLVNVNLINGAPPGSGSGGGSQTPWLSDIDAANYSLNNLGGITSQREDFTITAPSFGTVWLGADPFNTSFGVNSSAALFNIQARFNANAIVTSPNFLGIGVIPPMYPLDVAGEAHIAVSDAAHIPLRLVGNGAFTVLDLSDPAVGEAQIMFHVAGGVSSSITAYADRIGFSYSTDTDVLTVHVNGINVNNGTLTVPNMPVTAPAAGSKQLWADPADGYRVKWVI